jgi:hypothetical protein
MLISVASLALLVGGGTWLWNFYIAIPRAIIIYNSDLAQVYALTGILESKKVFLSRDELGMGPALGFIFITLGVILMIMAKSRRTAVSVQNKL